MNEEAAAYGVDEDEEESSEIIAMCEKKYGKNIKEENRRAILGRRQNNCLLIEKTKEGKV